MDAAKETNRGYRASDNTRRLVYSLMLVPLVPALAFIGSSATDQMLARWSIDDLRWFHFLSASIWVTSIIAIWRKVIVWTLGRKWLTVLVSLIPFVQVVYGQALWNIGCHKDELRISQFQVGIGVWIWFFVWVWWLWEKRNMSKDIESAKIRTPRLPRSVMRIVASIGLLPAMFGIFFITGFVLNDLYRLSESSAFVGAYVFVAFLTLVIWVRIWWGAVAWSQRVLLTTVLWAIVLMVLPSFGILFTSRSNSVGDTILLLLPVIGWGIWMALTVRYWPMKIAAGRSDMTPRCLCCGYLLTGLRGTRCPECGDEPTLDELWAATAGEAL